MKMTIPFVFGLEFVKPEYEWVILSEGLFDALSVKGLAIMHNEINEDQVNLINDLQKRIIVVPDLDKSGLSNSNNSLINTALDNNWDVAIPEWDCKDNNEAYVKYGPLFVIKHILDKASNNHISIKLKQKMFLNGLKDKND
jgi:5S rRNA maturation endonuclease (ribonuclease M5)